MTKQTQMFLWVLGGLVIVGGGGTAIYLATKKPSVGGEGKLPASTSTEVDTRADADAKAAAAAAATKAAVDAAVKATVEAAHAALIKAGLNAGLAMFTARQGVAPDFVDLNIGAVHATIGAVQAVGVAPNDVLGIVWQAMVAFWMSHGKTRSQAEDYATKAQANAGFGTHTASQIADLMSFAQLL